jgi:hypothetical protein
VLTLQSLNEAWEKLVHPERRRRRRKRRRRKRRRRVEAV